MTRDPNRPDRSPTADPPTVRPATLRSVAVSRMLALLAVCGLLVAAPTQIRAQAEEAGAPDAVDTKPLRPLMVEIAQDMSRINTGIWHEDYELIVEGGRSIAEHPKIPQEQMARIKEALGPEFNAFVKFDKTVHGGAAALAEAAARENMSAVLEEYTTVRNGCVGCHTAFRDRVREVLRQATF